jgi:hypothetical protein
MAAKRATEEIGSQTEIPIDYRSKLRSKNRSKTKGNGKNIKKIKQNSSRSF